MSPEPKATLDDLRLTDGQAELISGRIVHSPPAGNRPSRIAGEIFLHLDRYALATGRGEAFTSTVGFVVPLLRSGRQSFCADASYYDGPFPSDLMDFLPGPPTFAVEIRDEIDSGSSAESARAAKRADYFEAGTLVVWDVDPESNLIHSYLATSPDLPTTFSPGQLAHAEPALPGWRVAVDDLFA